MEYSIFGIWHDQSQAIQRINSPIGVVYPNLVSVYADHHDVADGGGKRGCQNDNGKREKYELHDFPISTKSGSNGGLLEMLSGNDFIMPAMSNSPTVIGNAPGRVTISVSIKPTNDAS